MAAQQASFALSSDFVSAYSQRPVPFGYDGLGEFVFKRTYARSIITESDSGLASNAGETLEQWYQTVERVVNGTMNMLRRHLGHRRWREEDYAQTAEEMYEHIFNMKFLPSGRGLWAMGSPLTEERGLYAALSNCAFVSTLHIGSESPQEAIDPFFFLMDACMCGIGVGFDTMGEGRRSIVAFVDSGLPRRTVDHVIADSREGWVNSLAALLIYYFFGGEQPLFDYSLIRPEGSPIRTFGGVSGGPEPLKYMHRRLSLLFEDRRGERLTITDIVDIMNIIGKCVVSGNVRRSAEIAMGPHTKEFIELKNANVNPQRMEHAWISNNTVKAVIGADYTDIAEAIRLNGEPGLFWLENVQRYSRIREDGQDYKDSRAIGTNPCAEQPLEHHELCCLVETFPAKHASYEEFAKTLELAALYAKVVSLGETHWPKTNEVMRRNRRIGVSMSGIVQFINLHGKDALEQWCERGYAFLHENDALLSERLCTARSIKITTVKPSGTVSLLAGATPGVHFPISPYYIRRVRIPRTSTLLEPLRTAGYPIVPADAAENTFVVEFPVFVGSEDVRSESSVSMYEQLDLVAFMQRHWSDNGVSATIKFNPATEGRYIKDALEVYQHQLKAISFLPNVTGVYKLAPYETIDKEEYQRRRAALLSAVDWTNIGNNEPKEHEYCDTDGCTTPLRRD